jgi:parallel beta-helix repeat protein
MLHGPHVLLLRRGSYIEVAQTATASLTDMELKGIGPRRSRPFLLALGGRLLLAHDDLLGLGRLSSMAYGISFVAAAAGSGVLHSVVSDDLTGIYATDTSGLRIEDNQISNSEVDGVELHDAVTAAVVNGNLVATSGLHDIVLGVNVTRTAVVHDTVSGAEEHGIVLYDGASNDRVVADTVRGCLDGIVIADASRNEIHGNLVSARRFALRISGRSRHNRVTGNIFSRSLIGAYITRGPADNRLLANTYRSDRENVRIRAGSPGNVVRPIPAASELWSH